MRKFFQTPLHCQMSHVHCMTTRTVLVTEESITSASSESSGEEILDVSDEEAKNEAEVRASVNTVVFGISFFITFFTWFTDFQNGLQILFLDLLGH